MKSLVKEILKSKKPKLGEIEVTLFEFCNLKCDFCFHKVNDKTGLTKEEIMEKLSTIFSFSNSIKEEVKVIQLNMVGGELMIDSLIEVGYLEIYKEFILEVNKYYKEIGIDLRVVFVSNYLFNNESSIKIEKMINELKTETKSYIGMIASYDFSGRPMNQLWKENLKRLKNVTVSINTVMTKPALEHLMIKGDKYWEEEIYPNFETFFDFFIPDKGSNDLIPPDSLLLDFYKWVSDKYPNINPIKDMLKTNEMQPMSCLSLNKITIFPDGSTSNCRWKRYDDEDFKNELNYDDNSNMMMDYITEYNCFSCEYYSICTFRCFTQWSWNGRIRDVEGCVNKHFYNYLFKDKK
jgi:uncharacterized protein YutD